LILVEFKLPKIIFLSNLILIQAASIVLKVMLFLKIHSPAFIKVFVDIIIQVLSFLDPEFFVNFLTKFIFVLFFNFFHIHELLHKLYQNP